MFSRIPGRLAVFVLAVLPLSGCALVTDLGIYCQLVKRNPADTNPADGIDAIAVTQGELPNTGADPESRTDFVSFGATGCENLVCVRNAEFEESVEDGLAIGAGQPAFGVCSVACVPGNADSCRSGDSSVDNDPRKRLTCRALVLDEDTLGRIRQADPERYERYFGNNTSPYFCARG
ncbi:MAG: adventurous gliding motility lipoprotein CglC [Myxococcaceae bacterium]